MLVSVSMLLAVELLAVGKMTMSQMVCAVTMTAIVSRCVNGGGKWRELQYGGQCGGVAGDLALIGGGGRAMVSMCVSVGDVGAALYVVLLTDAAVR